MDKGKRALQTATQKIRNNYSITQFLQDNLSLVFPFWLNYEPSCQKVGTQMYARLWQGPPPLDLAIIQALRSGVAQSPGFIARALAT